MGKKQPTTSQAAAKAAKKAKVAQKVERKETKKVLKTKKSQPSGPNKQSSKPKKKQVDDSDTDGDNLEGILENVSDMFCSLSFGLNAMFSDAERMGRSPYSY
jgi:hypothetical protein